MRKLEVVQERPLTDTFTNQQTWVRFNNDNFIVITYGDIPNTSIWKADWEGFIKSRFHEYENLTHSEAIVQFEQFLQSKERIKRDKRNLAAREKYEVYKTLGLKRTPYGWE